MLSQMVDLCYSQRLSEIRKLGLSPVSQQLHEIKFILSLDVDQMLV